MASWVATLAEVTHNGSRLVLVDAGNTTAEAVQQSLKRHGARVMTVSPQEADPLVQAILEALDGT